MNREVADVALRCAALALYVGGTIVFALLAASGPSLDVADTVSTLASVYACTRLAAALRASVATTFAEVRA